ncbi:MAG: Tim44 domain-containing protein [Robiginitomaculum sp.]|nr:Tim44 domain-containing protein [Robiginitomaculum sp.]
MQELILYAVLALIVGAMLFSVLGKNVGESLDTPLDPQDALDKFKNKSKAAPNPKIDFEGPAAEGLSAIHAADPDFSVPVFIDGAQTAYGMILEAFADGDKDVLGTLLNTEVKESYYAAIDDRLEKNLSQTTDLARLISAEIVTASLVQKTGRIGVLYQAELATALLDDSGEIVGGDLDILSRVSEVWSYERKLSSKNPNWLLCCVEPHDVHEGETDGPDHSPDTV